MPNPGLDRPIRKVTMNFYEEDILFLERWYGFGWQGRIRDIVHDNLADAIAASKARGDLDYD